MLSADARGARLRARGARVRVHVPGQSDIEPYRRAVEASRARLAPWNPVNPADLVYHLRVQSSQHRTFLVRALQPEGEHDVVGKVNVTNVVRGRSLAGTLGYDSYDPYAGRGLFAEGLRLIVDLALAPEPDGMGLHRVEAHTQPGNVRSAGLLRGLGFRRRAANPRYLWLADGTGREGWRDHFGYAVNRSEWPAPAYALDPPARPVVVLLRGEADSDALRRREDLAARAAAEELGVPLIRDADGDRPGVLAARLSDAVSGAVVLTGRVGEVRSILVAAGCADRSLVTRAADVDDARDRVRIALEALAIAGVSGAAPGR